MKELALRQTNELTQEQLDLIRTTVAKGATPDELKLFLYRAKNLGLDPLKPGQIFFIKYGSNPGSIVVGIEGIRAKAHRTGMVQGINRGVLRDEKGKCIGAWCEVHVKGWTHPAREEVSLSEYNTGKAQWLKMPETMIKKVAEAAALRMALPEDLGGVYTEEEMHQAEHVDVRAKQIEARLVNEHPPEIELDAEPDFITEAAKAPPQDSLADYVIKVGKAKGKKLKDLSITQLKNAVSWMQDQEELHPSAQEYLDNAIEYLIEQEQK